MPHRTRPSIVTPGFRAVRAMMWLVSLAAMTQLTMACSNQNSSDRVATEDLHMSLTAMRHNDYLMVQVTLFPNNDREQRIELNGGDHLLASLNGEIHELEAHWNGVYSTQIPYQEGVLKVDLKRSGNQVSATGTQLNLPVSPEFQSPRPNAMFHTQSDDHIRLSWTGIATENGEYELRCTQRNHGTNQFNGTFSAIDRQSVNLPMEELLENVADLHRRGFCEAQFTLRGISTTGAIAPEFADGELMFESHVSRNAIIRHNALF